MLVRSAAAAFRYLGGWFASIRSVNGKLMAKRSERIELERLRHAPSTSKCNKTPVPIDSSSSPTHAKRGRSAKHECQQWRRLRRGDIR
jgi:hypothetical protein